jgi:ribosomal protein S18 acetylase RimI-like enzyme
MDLDIRPAQKHEWDKLVDIYRREGLTNEVVLVSKDARQEFAEIGARRLIWFAQVNNRVEGSIQLVLDSDQKILANGSDRAMIHHLRVSQAFQNSGIGSLLNQTIEAEAINRKIKTLTLEVEKKNTKATAIYKHWGYSYLCDGKNPTEIIMKKMSI